MFSCRSLSFPLRAAAAVCLFPIFLGSEVEAKPKAQGPNSERPAILDTRPCGPDAITGPLRHLIFQGCAGADFRDPCRRHDACYDTIASDRATCDRRFLEEMLAECPKSRFPCLARLRARFAYLSARVAGAGAWRSAQRLAMENARK